MTHRPRALGRVAGAALALALVTGCEFNGAYDLPLPGHAVNDEESFQIKASFADVLNVVPRSAVMVDDVTVGEVRSVRRVGWHAEVELWVRNDVELPDNAIAEIRQTSLLGEKYVALLPPEDATPTGRLSEGDEIPLSATGRNPEVEEVLGALSFLLSGGGVGQLATITHELNAVMDGRQGNLRQLLQRMDGVVATLDEQKGAIIRAMTSLNELTATLNREKETIGDALSSLAPAVEVLAAQHENLMKMLRELDKLGVIGTQLIGATKDDVISVLSDLEPVLDRLHEAGSSIGPGLSLLLSFPFPVESNDIVHGDYANTVMTVHVALSAESLPGGGGGGGGGGLPGLPDLGLPDLGLPDLGLPDLGLTDLPLLRTTAASNGGGSATTLADCVRSNSILEEACAPWVATSATFQDLLLVCKVKELSRVPVCRSLAPVPLRKVRSTGSVPVMDAYDTALTTAFDTPLGTADGLYTGGDV